MSALLIPGASHCMDMAPERPSDSPSLRLGRQVREKKLWVICIVTCMLICMFLPSSLGSDFQNSPHLSTEHLPAAADLAQAGKGEPRQGWGLSPTLWPLLARPPQPWTHSFTGQGESSWYSQGRFPGIAIHHLSYVSLTCKHPHSQRTVLCYRQRRLQIQLDEYSVCECW